MSHFFPVAFEFEVRAVVEVVAGVAELVASLRFGDSHQLLRLFFFPGLDQVDVDAFLVNFSRDAPFLMRLALFLSVMVYIFSTPLTVFVPWPALWLPRGLRARHTARLASHPIYVVRQTMTMLKMIAGMAWGQDPAVRARLHLEAYEPDPATWRPAS